MLTRLEPLIQFACDDSGGCVEIAEPNVYVRMENHPASKSATTSTLIVTTLITRRRGQFGQRQLRDGCLGGDEK